ncbi:photosystem II reaction center protein J, partial [Striga asiatica]
INYDGGGGISREIGVSEHEKLGKSSDVCGPRINWWTARSPPSDEGDDGVQNMILKDMPKRLKKGNRHPWKRNRPTQFNTILAWEAMQASELRSEVSAVKTGILGPERVGRGRGAGRNLSTGATSGRPLLSLVGAAIARPLLSLVGVASVSRWSCDLRSDDKTHAERRFDKKMQFYDLVRSAVAKKAISKEKQQKKRSRQKRLKAYDLSSLSEYLPEVNSPSELKPAELKINSKTRNKLVLKEGNQLKTVINHPIFQSDPLGAIYQHLQNTQPAVDTKPKIKDDKTRKKKLKQKSSKGLQSMEI